MSIIVKTEVNADLSPDNLHVDVTFGYDPYLVDAMRNIRSGRFIPVEKGGPLWRFPLTIETGKELRKALGAQFTPSPAYKRWQMRQRSVALELRSLSAGDSATLSRLPELLPDLYQAIHIGPIGRTYDEAQRTEALSKKGSFQTADVKFMATAEFPINANHPGTGKTLEAIAAAFEEGLDEGPKLVIAPLTSLETVWVQELSDWQYQDIILCFGGKGRKEDAIAAAKSYIEAGDPFWFVTNPHTVMMQAHYEEHPVTGERTGKRKFWNRFPALYEIDWDLIILDEFQKMGLANDTNTSKGIFALKKKKGMGLSGTPIKGKPINLWGIMHFLDPLNHKSKWKWADEWLVVEQGAYGKQIGDVRKEKEEAFWDMIGRFMIRRTKAEVVPWLPAKEHINVWVEMEGKQKKQYDTFAELAEIAIDEQNMSATSILAEYTRLKQFSFSAQRIETIKDPPYYQPFPTVDSCKLPYLEQLLNELGIIVDDSGEWEGEQAIIFSQFTRVVDFIDKWLQEKGVRTTKITGDITGHNRAIAQRQFQSDDPARPQVIVMNTTAGGVSITLDNANTVIFLDETWVPDEQEQAEDRAHRASRIHQVTVYYIRTKGSIEEYIHRRVQGKENINKRILDLRREGLKATGDK